MIKKLKIERLIFLTCLIICLITIVISGLEVKAMQAEIEELQYQNSRQAAQLKDRKEQIEILEIIIENMEQEEPEYLGIFTVTHYCPCVKCCNKTDGITFTGTQATEGRTVAVDPDVIPLGSTVVIDGEEYIAEDIGGAIKGLRIDKYMDNHQEALNAGVVQAEVWIGGRK
jgi:3D (Asp-Asp-Asp) domain-containing protein